MLEATFDHTPGYAGLAQPYPHDVAPSTNQKPPFSHTKGPPLSPWQASVVPPLLLPLAQSISSVMAPEDKVPQPVIQHSEPAATGVSGRQAAPTPGPKSKGGETLNSIRSLLMSFGEL